MANPFGKLLMGDVPDVQLPDWQPMGESQDTASATNPITEFLKKGKMAGGSDAGGGLGSAASGAMGSGGGAPESF